ncbi:dephospho-CoA kinase [Polycladidibacter stylochi]|uniref:dephospho-CoA kinase n=1 Tax=Polycladidibacter stylochi TaxID=1807766 RepID=UPI00082C0044|nr:dephospho-CoA kinase [Pseudovibrio stylochi]
MRIIGLTGSIGMGKSTTAKMFAKAGAAVYDADAAVHKQYKEKAVPAIAAAFPSAIKEGAICRQELGKLVLGNPEAFKRLEDIVHPLVQEEERAFLQSAWEQKRRFVVLDIPLLLEKPVADRVDTIVVVTANEKLQRERVLARPNMTADKMQAILSKQMPDAQKRLKAHFIVHTDRGLKAAEQQVNAILKALS